MLWDVDGTLVDSSEYHWLSWREALAAEGLAPQRIVSRSLPETAF